MFVQSDLLLSYLLLDPAEPVGSSSTSEYGDGWEQLSNTHSHAEKLGALFHGKALYYCLIEVATATAL